jgi:peptidylprolyl isomerase
MEVNDTKKVTLSAEDGYGPVDPEAKQAVGLDAVPEEGRHEGALLQATDSTGQTRVVRVQEVNTDHVVLDLNHQLAGKDLNFDVRILSINQ